VADPQNPIYRILINSTIDRVISFEISLAACENELSRVVENTITLQVRKSIKGRMSSITENS